jgi:UDPglucose 6-dehydrogenase
MTRHVTVVGAGYLGTAHAVCMAELGFEVLGMDTDAARIARLAEGHAPFHEPDLEPLLRKHVESGRLAWTTSYEHVAEFGDVHFVCVGTPQRPGHLAADLTALEEVVDGLAPRLRRACLLVGKSTVPVGTAAGIAERVAALAPAGREVRLAWSPEFLREGHAIEDTLHPDRLVAGVQDARAEQALREIYASQLDDGVPFVVTDFATAELAKGAANAFLATKISFINAMAELCEQAGGNVAVLAEVLGYDERIGRTGLNAGVGFGGGCLPKDIRAFAARASELGAEAVPALLAEVDRVNTRRRARTVTLAREVCGGSLSGIRAGVLGAAFKPDSDDVRDSPALDVAEALRHEGARVRVYDPQATDNARQASPELCYAGCALQACRDADVVLHLTEWREFRYLDPAAVAEVVAARRVIDGRGTLDARAWREAGWSYHALGRGSAVTRDL